MLRERWGWAGVLWGVALGLKTIAILFVPVWIVALLLYRKRAWDVLVGVGLAAGLLFVVSVPFILSGGGAWFTQSYTQNLSAYADRTTMMAFNLWYADLLITDSYDAGATVLGISKNMWGRLFLLAGLAGGAWTVWSRRQNNSRTLLFWTVACLLAAVMLPTRVHERYLLIVLPFLAVAAMLTWRLWPVLFLLTVVAMGQVTWPIWMPMAGGQSAEIRSSVMRAYGQDEEHLPDPQSEAGRELNKEVQRRLSNYFKMRAATTGWEWTFTLLALFGWAMTVLALYALPPTGDRASPTAETEW
jgi:hypothetical protein